MAYSQSQIYKIKAKIIAKLNLELMSAESDEDIDAILEKYDVVFEEKSMPVDTRSMKILVLGALSGNVEDFQLTAKKMDVPLKNIEFVNDYAKLTNFDIRRLEGSFEYSDIIYGPNPHKQINIGDYSSALSLMKANPDKYPRVTEAIANDKLKITISNFKQCILKTRYYEALND